MSKRTGQVTHLDSAYQRVIQQQLGLSTDRCCVKKIDMRYLASLDGSGVTPARKIFLEQFFQATVKRLQGIDTSINAGCLRGQISWSRAKHNSARNWSVFLILLTFTMLAIGMGAASTYQDELEIEVDDTDGYNYRRHGEPRTYSGSMILYITIPIMVVLLWYFSCRCYASQKRRGAFIASAAVKLNEEDNTTLTQINELLTSIKALTDGVDAGVIQLEVKSAEPARHELPQHLIRQCHGYLAVLAQYADGAKPEQKDGQVFMRGKPTRGLVESKSLLRVFSSGGLLSRSGGEGYHALDDNDFRGGIALSPSIQSENLLAVRIEAFINSVYTACKQKFFPALGNSGEQNLHQGDDADDPEAPQVRNDG